jgi:hypothetical protein
MNKRKLTSAEKRAKKERKAKFMFIFVNGRQKRVRRPPTIDGLSEEEFIAANADPIWLHQNEMWELIPFDPAADTATDTAPRSDRDDQPRFCFEDTCLETDPRQPY